MYLLDRTGVMHWPNLLIAFYLDYFWVGWPQGLDKSLYRPAGDERHKNGAFNIFLGMKVH